MNVSPQFQQSFCRARRRFFLSAWSEKPALLSAVQVICMFKLYIDIIVVHPEGWCLSVLHIVWRPWGRFLCAENFPENHPPKLPLILKGLPSRLDWPAGGFPQNNTMSAGLPLSRKKLPHPPAVLLYNYNRFHASTYLRAVFYAIWRPCPTTVVHVLDRFINAP